MPPVWFVPYCQRCSPFHVTISEHEAGGVYTVVSGRGGRVVAAAIEEVAVMGYRKVSPRSSREKP